MRRSQTGRSTSELEAGIAAVVNEEDLTPVPRGGWNDEDLTPVPHWESPAGRHIFAGFRCARDR